MNYAFFLKFATAKVKIYLNLCKTYCIVDSVSKLSQKLLGEMSCNFGFAHLKLLKIDFCFERIIYLYSSCFGKLNLKVIYINIFKYLYSN